MKSKIGIFGGLFNPPHIGHLIIVQWVLEEFNLDKIIFVPAFNPPHKLKYLPYSVRYKMTELAIKDNENFIISNIEKNIHGKTYTVEVIRALKDRLHLFPHPSRKDETEFYLIIGADQWGEIETWRNPEKLFDECKIIVLPRPNYKIKKKQPFYKKILISKSPLINISSSVVRERIKKGLDIRYFVPETVLKYIKKHKLYICVNPCRYRR